MPLFCPSKEIRALADIVNVKCAGSGGDVLDPEEDDMDEFDTDFTVLHGVLDETTEALEGERLLDIKDLVGPEIDVGQGGMIKVDEVVSFVVLKKNPDEDKSWTVPTPGLFNELIMRVSNDCFERNLTCQRAYRWATL